jgi:hypothetical protein
MTEMQRQIRGRDIVGYVKGEMTVYTPQADDGPGRIVRCGSEKRNRTCGEEKVPNTRLQTELYSRGISLWRPRISKCRGLVQLPSVQLWFGIET